MQLNYSQLYDLATPGMPRGENPRAVESYASCDPNAIPFGSGVVWGISNPKTVRAPRLNSGLVTISTDLIAANSTIVTVNGVSTTATVYAGSHNDTMAAILVKVLALSTVTGGSTTGDTMTIVTGDLDAAITWATTLGSSQPTVTYAYTSADVFAGLAQFEQRESTLEAIGSATNDGGTGASAGQGYLFTNMVSVVRFGVHAAPCAAAVTAYQGNAYIITAVTNRGLWTPTSSGNIKGGKFRSLTTTLNDGVTVIADVQTDVPALN